MLSFEDWNQTVSFMESVTNAHEKHLDDFYEKYQSYSDEEVDSIEDILKWEHNQVYIDIENKYNVNTLKNFVDDKLYKQNLQEKEREYWSQFLVEDDFGAILNENSMVLIGDSVYKFLQNMAVIASETENYKIVSRISEENLDEFLTHANIKIHGYDFEAKSSKNCRANRQQYDHTWWTVNGTSRTRTIKGWLVIRNLPTGAGGFSIRYVRAITQTEEFRRRRNRRWRTSSIRAVTFGQIYRNNSPYNCVGTKENCGSNSDPKTTSRLNSTYKNQSINQLLIFRAKEGEVGSSHFASGGSLHIGLN